MRILDLWRTWRKRSGFLRKADVRLRRHWYALLELLYPKGMPIELSEGRTFRLHPRFLGMTAEHYEPQIVTQFSERLKPGDVVLDVGAHVGLHTLMLSRIVGPMGHVLAIEPSPSSAMLLQRHLAWNGCANVEVLNAAAGSREEKVAFSFRADPTDPGSFANSIAYQSGDEECVVSVITLDSLAGKIRPNLIKIDVEGAEQRVIEGARELLTRCDPVLIVAVHPEPMRFLGSTPASLVALLESYGYRGWRLDGRRADDPGFEEIIFEKTPAQAATE